MPAERRDDATQRLGAFEDLLEDFEAGDPALPAQFARLKAAGKEKTVTYREALGLKLLDMFDRRGLTDG